MFPENIHAAVFDAFNAFLPTILPEITYHFAPAWNGVSQRYRIARQYQADFDAVVGDAGSGTQRFEEDKALFGFFTAASSVVDCLAYALHAVGAAVVPQLFSAAADDLRRVNLKSVSSSYDAYSADTDIARQLRTLRSDAQLKSLGAV